MLTKPWVMTVGVFLISLISITTPVASLVLKELPIENETLVWGLTGATQEVSDQLNMGDEGTLLQNYTIEVKAGAKNYNLMLEDHVHLTLTAFSPISGISERQGEFWYVQDSRIVTPKKVVPGAIRVKYNP